MWATLYFTTPFLVAVTGWVKARGAQAVVDGPLLPASVRVVLGLAGADALIASVALFIAPARTAELWPWY